MPRLYSFKKKLFQKFALILVTSIYFLVSSFYFVSPVLAAEEPKTESTWYNQGPLEWYIKISDPSNPSEIFGERYTSAQVQWVIYGLMFTPFNMLAKYNPEAWNCLMAATQGDLGSLTCVPSVVKLIDDAVSLWKTASGIAQDRSDSVLAQRLDSTSFSGIGYVYSTAKRAFSVPTVNAQGFGYTALNPIQSYWKGARDIAYSLVVLITIVFAFMIMFRVKLNPQTVISVQSSIPKIITALILVTFSYAISGFMIDLMYLAGGIIAMLIKTANFSSNQVTDIYRYIIPSMSNTNGLWIFYYMVGYFVLFVVAILLNLISLAVAGAGNFLVATILTVVMFVMLVWCLVLVFWFAIKIPWVLIKNLISIYVSIIFSPLTFLTGTLYPQGGFGPWFRKLLAELLVYPLTGAAFYISWKLLLQSMYFGVLNLTNFGGIMDIINNSMSFFGYGNLFNTFWVPSIVGTGDIVAGFLFLLASFGIIIGIPKLPDLLKSVLLGAKFDYGTAIGEAMTPVMWGKKQFVDPITGSYQQAAGRKAVLATQKSLEGWYQTKKGEGKNFNPWLERWIKANTGAE